MRRPSSSEISPWEVEREGRRESWITQILASSSLMTLIFFSSLPRSALSARTSFGFRVICGCEVPKPDEGETQENITLVSSSTHAARHWAACRCRYVHRRRNRGRNIHLLSHLAHSSQVLQRVVFLCQKLIRSLAFICQSCAALL